MLDTSFETIPYKREMLTAEQVEAKSKDYFDQLNSRRSVRDFEDWDVPRSAIENIIKTASSAPSGAHKQPWTFVAVQDKEVKKRIRAAAEAEEMEFYNNRASEDWLKDLAPLGTNWSKPFLEVAPWLIVVFKKIYNDLPEGRTKNYYVQESVGIASGFLISAIHNAGLATLTHTPSPMNFLSEILERPENEKPFLLLPVGYPSRNAQVPDLTRKSLEEVSVFI